MRFRTLSLNAGTPLAENATRSLTRDRPFERLAATVARTLVALAVAGAVVLAMDAAGWLGDGQDALVVMGFDPDRAQLIMALTAAAIAAAGAALATGRRAAPIVASLLVTWALFGSTFVDETRTALTSGASSGGFDPVGWVVTLITLLAAGLATGWASATLALEVRRCVASGASLVTDSVRRRGLDARRLARTLLPLAAILLTMALLPTFADMINYTPDVAMTRNGMGAAMPLVGGSGGSPGGGGSTSGSPASGPNGGGSAGVPLTGTSGSATSLAPPGSIGPLAAAMPPGVIVPATAVSASRPWMATRPSGGGTIETASLPSPWTGGHQTRSTLWVYLPAGYRGVTQRYPTIYLVPWDLAHWEYGVHVVSALDAAIGQGAIPPMIAVFVDLGGGRFPVSECANSYDGTEWADTYVSRTVVGWADAHLRTIADPRARTILGFSQGGFCAANLQMRHPNVFGQSVVFSGYFTAGLRSGDTVNAWRPFGNVPSVIAANSPIQIVGTLPVATRDRLFSVISGEPGEAIYGAQATAYASTLQRDGVAVDLLWTPLGHAWKAVRTELTAALEAVAGRMVTTGVL